MNSRRKWRSASSGNKEKDMKRSFILLITVVILALIPVAILAEESPPNNKMKLIGEIGVDFFSKYVGSTSGGVAYNRPVVQGNAKISLLPFGLYAKFWGSGILISDGRKFGGNEIDYIVGIARPIWKFKVDIGYGYYDLHPQFRGRGDLHGLYGTILYPNKIVEPYLTVECDLPTVKKALEGGWLYRAGIMKSIELRKNLILTGDVSFGGNDGAYGFRPDPISYARGGLTLCWSPWKNFSISPQLYYQKRLGHHPSNGGIARDAFWGGMSFSFKHELLSF